MSDYINTAKEVFAGTKYDASENDIRMLADNMAILEKRGLGKLNKRLIDVRKHDKIFETIAEHNFAMTLISKHCSTILVKYEEPQIDFKVEIEDITYWIQMKAPAELKKYNMQWKIIQEIKREAEKIKIGKFFSCKLSDDFKKDSLKELIAFIKDKAESAIEGEKNLFTNKSNQTAEITLRSAKNIVLSELTIGDWGDLNIVEITGLPKEQIKEGLVKAANAFTWQSDQRNINLIAIEADNKKDIDICDALFGTEYYVGKKTGSRSWSRKNDGLFINDDFSKKVAGVIAVKKKRKHDEGIALLSPEEAASRLSPAETEYTKNWNLNPKDIKEALESPTPGPIADYSANFYINNSFKHILKDVEKLISLDKVISYSMRHVENGIFNS